MCLPSFCILNGCKKTDAAAAALNRNARFSTIFYTLSIVFRNPPPEYAV